MNTCICYVTEQDVCPTECRMTLKDIGITICSALAEFSGGNPFADETAIFMSRGFFLKCCAASMQIVNGQDRIAYYMGIPIHEVDVPGDVLWVGREFPIKVSV